MQSTSDYNCNKSLIDAVCKAFVVSRNRYDCVKSDVTLHYESVFEMKLLPKIVSTIENDCRMHTSVNITEICSWFTKYADEINFSHLVISTQEVGGRCSNHPNQTNDDVAMIDVTVSSSRFDPDEGTTNPYENANRLQQLQDTTVPGTQ